MPTITGTGTRPRGGQPKRAIGWCSGTWLYDSSGVPEPMSKKKKDENSIFKRADDTDADDRILMRRIQGQGKLLEKLGGDKGVHMKKIKAARTAIAANIKLTEEHEEKHIVMGTTMISAEDQADMDRIIKHSFNNNLSDISKDYINLKFKEITLNRARTGLEDVIASETEAGAKIDEKIKASKDAHDKAYALLDARIT